jgi:hypothetical protein
MNQRWETADEVVAAKQAFIAAMPGFRLPVTYSVARCDADGAFTFAYINEVGGTHELPAAVLATVCGYRDGNATVGLTRDEFAAAVELLAPAEPCKAFDHPNLWSWRRLLAESAPDAKFVAVFVADANAAPATDADAALRVRLTSQLVEPGAPVALERRKWPDRPHYRHRGTVLGSDAHGVWLATHPQPFYVGDEFAFEAVTWAAQLVPHTGGWWAAFLPHDAGFDLYVDIGTPPRWNGRHVSMIDLDLDVVRWKGRPVEIADADEFATNAQTYCYPADVIADAQATADAILDAVRNERPPFDGTGRAWLGRALTSTS